MAETFEPHAYQKTAIKYLLQHGFAGLGLDPGLGKTAIALSALQALCKVKRERALVVAPLRPCSDVWSHTGELGKWAQFNGLKVALLHGPKKAEAVQADADLYVINWDALHWLCPPARIKVRNELGKVVCRNNPEWPGPIKVLLDKGVRLLVLDELSKAKHSGTRRFKSLTPWLERFTRRWGLTGSPNANGLMGLFGQCYCLDLGQALGRYITHFRTTYFLPTGFQGREWGLQKGASKRIYDKIRPFWLTMRATDHLPELPDLVTENVWLDLPPTARALYDKFEKDLVAAFENHTIVANNAASVSGKCRQIASGGAYIVEKDRREALHVHNTKTLALQELIEELQGAPLLVGYEFRHDLERIRAVLGEVPAINGDTNVKQSSTILAAWNAGQIPVLAVHPQAGAHGLNAQGCGCGHLVWYTAPWDRELYDQLIARVWRQGNTASAVVVHQLLMRRTVDEVVARALGTKGRAQNGFFEAFKAYVKDHK
jgi:SNF2 family DNA or RNA helicase